MWLPTSSQIKLPVDVVVESVTVTDSLEVLCTVTLNVNSPPGSSSESRIAVFVTTTVGATP